MTEETELELIFIDSCTRCGNVERIEMSMELSAPINEAERKKYCTDFIGKTTQLEELSALLEVVAEMKEHSGPEPVPVKSKPVPQLEQLNIPDLESRVTACLEKSGFIKVVFQVPRMEAQVLIDLTLQDPTKRPESVSLRLFKKQINELLSPTNWRLAKEAGYRMGMISAQLVGYDKKEDLLRLAKRKKK